MANMDWDDYLRDEAAIYRQLAEPAPLSKLSTDSSAKSLHLSCLTTLIQPRTRPSPRAALNDMARSWERLALRAKHFSNQAQLDFFARGGVKTNALARNGLPRQPLPGGCG